VSANCAVRGGTASVTGLTQARGPIRRPRRTTLSVGVLAGAIPFAALPVPPALADGGTGGFSVTGSPGGAGGTGFAAPGNDGSNGGNVACTRFRGHSPKLIPPAVRTPLGSCNRS
jgi:hypothetical protein